MQIIISLKNYTCKYGDGTYTAAIKYMGTLIEKFREQRMDPSVILSSSDSELARLGVSTIGDRVRLRELCKEAEENTRQPRLHSMCFPPEISGGQS